jgi:ornithine carbamoyltransferase
MTMTESAVLPIPAVACCEPGTVRRHVLSILDLAPEEVTYLARRAVQLKQAPTAPQTLEGRTVGVYFRKTSTRTRSGFLVGAGRLGATTVYFGPNELQTTTGETTEDTARTLAGYLDVLVMRTNEALEEMQVYASHPSMSVVNALNSEEHPTQALTDLASMLEHFGRLEGISVLYCGEGNKTAAALALAMSRIPGMKLTLATPAGYGVDPRVLATAQSLAQAYGAAIEQTHDIDGVEPGYDVVYTSRWQEMGVSKADPEWKTHFHPFRVTRALMDRVGNEGAVFMHDLPAVRGEDVDDEVLDGPRSLAWVQAQYKMWSAMSVMEWCGAGVQDEG